MTLLKLHALDVLDQGSGLDALSVHLDEALSEGALFRPDRLSWCSSVGIDGLGVFADVTVAPVVFRMRYIEAGSFLMGSL